MILSHLILKSERLLGSLLPSGPRQESDYFFQLHIRESFISFLLLMLMGVRCDAVAWIAGMVGGAHIWTCTGERGSGSREMCIQAKEPSAF